MKTVNVTELKKIAAEIRCLIMDEIGFLGVGHIGGCLSVVEALTALYFHEMNVDPKDPKKQGRDRFVCSKGHAGPAVYATLAKKGYFDVEMLRTLNKSHTLLPSHCDMIRTPGIDMTAGSLGQGISCAVGMAKAAKILGEDSFVYCIIGDGESQEGQVWEASMCAAQLKLDNLVVFLDNNKMQIDGMTDEINSLLDPVKKWEAFGFDTYRVDGHDFEQLIKAIDSAKAAKNGKPSMIVMDTIKGKGVSFVEAAGAGNHNMNVNMEQAEAAIKEIKEREGI